MSEVSRNRSHSMALSAIQQARNLETQMKQSIHRPSKPPELRAHPFKYQNEEDVPITSWSSAFIASKPPSLQPRVTKLLSLQHKFNNLMMGYQEEALALEKKYLALVQPLYAKRRETITGLRERVFTTSSSPGHENEHEGREQAGVGIPNFWLQAMSNEPSLCDLIASRDEPVLSQLKDIRLKSLLNGKRGFMLIFTFGENEYFFNKTLTKTYTYIRAADESEDMPEAMYSAEYTYHTSTGDEIRWKEGKNLILEKGKDKDNQHQASFFEFFRAPVKPEAKEGEEPDREKQRTYEWLLEIDFDYGEVFKEKVIPYAVYWYTGEATLYEEESDECSDEDGDGDGDEDEDEDEDGSELESGKEDNEESGAH